jgi:hypothetical protein
MDPNETLRLMREHAGHAAAGRSVRDNERHLRWSFEELDKHLSQGGTLPDAWQCPEPSLHGRTIRRWA